MRNPLLLTLNELPPSVNSMYVHTKWGPRLTKEARMFFSRARLSLATQMCLGESADPAKAYRLILRFRLAKLENSGWPKTKTRFVGRDASNLIKVVEDVVASLIGINDSNFLGGQYHKVWAEEEGVDIVIQEVPEDDEAYTCGAPVPRMEEPWCPRGPGDFR